MSTSFSPPRIHKIGLRLLPGPGDLPRLEQVAEVRCRFEPEPQRWLLTWSAVQGAMAYEVRSTAQLAGRPQWIPAGTVSSPRLLLAAPAGWWACVRAIDGGGRGPWSDPVETRAEPLARRRRKAA